MREPLLIVLCFFVPFARRRAEHPRPLCALLLQLLGHVPGVIYGGYRIVHD